MGHHHHGGYVPGLYAAVRTYDRIASAAPRRPLSRRAISSMVRAQVRAERKQQEALDRRHRVAARRRAATADRLAWEALTPQQRRIVNLKMAVGVPAFLAAIAWIASIIPF